MEEREKEEEVRSAAAKTMSYRYWVRDVKEDAVPVPEPRKLSGGEEGNMNTKSTAESPLPMGSVWNKAGTWEEKSLNKWASHRLRELLMSVGPLELSSSATARISDVSKCDGDAFLVTVRNKRRVGYTYELSLKVEGRFEDRDVFAHLDIPEISFGESQDLLFQVRFDDHNLSPQHRSRLTRDFNLLFLDPIRQKLLQFERELKDT